MTEEKTPAKEEKITFLKELKNEREQLQKVRDENTELLNQLKEIKAEEIISGKADAGQKKEDPEEESPKDYADRALRGKI